MDTHDRFEKVNDDYLKFDMIEKKRNKRPDLHAFLLLDELQPGTSDIVSDAQHDIIYLDIEEETMEKFTDEQILELVRCGVSHSDEYDSLYMFT